MCFHGMGMWGRRLNFFVVVEAGELVKELAAVTKMKGL
jgi:hypothetical protein